MPLECAMQPHAPRVCYATSCLSSVHFLSYELIWVLGWQWCTRRYDGLTMNSATVLVTSYMGGNGVLVGTMV
jgi:hypothetical protein